MHIIIVGGSLAGVLTGLALKRRGHRVHVLERSPLALFQGNGAGILAGAETRAYMNQFDRSKRNLIVPATFRHYLDAHGHEIRREDWVHYATSWDSLYHVLRENFDASDPADGMTTYDYGANVTDLQVYNDRVTLVYEQNLQKKSISGDILIAADGASSGIRALLLPHVERTYAGYVVWRGTVLESDVSEATAAALLGCITFFHAPGMQFASYVIPGEHGALDRGQRLINWVWYHNYDDPSEVLTDCNGRRHRWTVPRGKLHPKVWDDLTREARARLPPPFVELFQATQFPFVQAVSDVLSPQATFHDGRVVLAGDALAGFRPHTAGATSQAAFHASQLWEKMTSWPDWLKNRSAYEEAVMEFARHGVEHGQKLGHVSQFGRHKFDGKLSMGYLTAHPEGVTQPADQE